MLLGESIETNESRWPYQKTPDYSMEGKTDHYIPQNSMYNEGCEAERKEIDSQKYE